MGALREPARSRPRSTTTHRRSNTPAPPSSRGNVGAVRNRGDSVRAGTTVLSARYDPEPGRARPSPWSVAGRGPALRVDELLAGGLRSIACRCVRGSARSLLDAVTDLADDRHAGNLAIHGPSRIAAGGRHRASVRLGLCVVPEPERARRFSDGRSPAGKAPGPALAGSESRIADHPESF